MKRGYEFDNGASCERFRLLCLSVGDFGLDFVDEKV